MDNTNKAHRLERLQVVTGQGSVDLDFKDGFAGFRFFHPQNFHQRGN
jgi:hypothetical protein